MSLAWRLLRVGVLAAMLGLAPCVASAGVVLRATLSAPRDAGVALGEVAVSGSVVVAASWSEAYVFTRPAAGWSDAGPSAVLIDSGGAAVDPSRLAIEGAIVVVPQNNHAFPTGDDVFVEPSGGWSGTVHESARLFASDGALLATPSISGQTIVSVGSNPRTGVDAVYVFTMPAGGWSGTVHEAARLMDSRGSGLEDAVVAGQTVFASGAGYGDVFTEPAGGSAGVRTEHAVLVDPDGLVIAGMSVSGTSLFAGNYVYREPLWGWIGSVRPTAFLYQARASGLVPGTDQVSGEAVARPASSQSATGVWLYSEPAGGWTGTRSAVPAVGFVHGWGNHSVAFASPDVFTAGPASVGVYEISGSFGRRARTPVLRHASLTVTGAGSRRPRVSFDLRAGVDAPPLRDFTLTLPRGLSFRSLRQVRAHLRILHSGRQIGLKLRSGRLLVRPLVPAVRISITLHPGALAERQALVGRLRAVRAFNRHHKQAEKHSVRGTIRVDATTVGDATQHLVKTIEMR